MHDTGTACHSVFERRESGGGGALSTEIFNERMMMHWHVSDEVVSIF
jgi:hypothetical protein